MNINSVKIYTIIIYPLQNAPNTAHCAIMRQNVMNVPKDIFLMKYRNVKVSFMFETFKTYEMGVFDIMKIVWLMKVIK